MSLHSLGKLAAILHDGWVDPQERGGLHTILEETKADYPLNVVAPLVPDSGEKPGLAADEMASSLDQTLLVDLNRKLVQSGSRFKVLALEYTQDKPGGGTLVDEMQDERGQRLKPIGQEGYLLSIRLYRSKQGEGIYGGLRTLLATFDSTGQVVQSFVSHNTRTP